MSGDADEVREGLARMAWMWWASMMVLWQAFRPEDS